MEDEDASSIQESEGPRANLVERGRHAKQDECLPLLTSRSTAS
jgi:hypothetical protein